MTAAHPAMAQETPNPEGGSSGERTATVPVQDDGLDANSVAPGALAGIALGGALGPTRSSPDRPQKSLAKYYGSG